MVSKSEREIEKFGNKLKQFFEVKDLGNASYCLGVAFERKNGKIELHQRGYILELLERFEMLESSPVSTPIEIGVKLTKCEYVNEADKSLPYRELIRGLIYLSTRTRPDIAFAVSYLSQFNDCYNSKHWKAAKRVLRYLNGTREMGLVFNSSPGPIVGYADADWGSCIVDRRSYTGYVFTFGGGSISWDSRKQCTVALSTTEAEYMALTEGVKEAIYLQGLIHELGMNELMRITVLGDNRSSLSLAKNSVLHAKTKHIDIRYHFIRHTLLRKDIDVQYVRNQVADFLTKGLPRVKHEWCAKSAGLGYLEE